MNWSAVLSRWAEMKDFDFDSLSIPQMATIVILELVENLFAVFLFWGTLYVVFYRIPSELSKLL